MEDLLTLKNEIEEPKKENRLKEFLSGIGFLNLSTAK
jgi:hypothetical protein